MTRWKVGGSFHQSYKYTRNFCQQLVSTQRFVRSVCTKIWDTSTVHSCRGHALRISRIYRRRRSFENTNYIHTNPTHTEFSYLVKPNTRSTRYEHVIDKYARYFSRLPIFAQTDGTRFVAANSIPKHPIRNTKFINLHNVIWYLKRAVNISCTYVKEVPKMKRSVRNRVSI